MKLLYIHGRSQEGKDPVKLQEEWEAAFGKGLRNAGLERPQIVEVAFPFYGDKLDELVRELAQPLMAEVAARGGTGATTKEMEFRYEFYSELAAGAGISDAQIQAQLGPEPVERGPLNWRWVHALLKGLDRTPFGSNAVDKFTHDVYVYLTKSAVSRAIDKIVADKLTAGRWVVVAHSLGTIVAYNVLRAIKPEQNIEVVQLVTVGSPLGVRAVRERLESPLSMPGCTKSWYNAYDKNDVVSLYPLDAHNFNITPPIENNGIIDNTTDNQHGISGYLDDANVARKIAQAF
ncbi:MAG: hypothetical protein JWL59_4352 [Chthoniobacteraceae bacterium]|nr:hypothetical protein [Chthoniobacteraceae bacterium]